MTKEEFIKLKEKTCLVCHRVFIPKFNGQKTCCRECGDRLKQETIRINRMLRTMTFEEAKAYLERRIR